MPQRENERLLTGIFTLVEHSDLVITGALQRKKESCCNGDDCRSTMTNDNRGLHASCRACDVRREREREESGAEAERDSGAITDISLERYSHLPLFSELRARDDPAESHWLFSLSLSPRKVSARDSKNYTRKKRARIFLPSLDCTFREVRGSGDIEGTRKKKRAV